MANFQQVKS